MKRNNHQKKKKKKKKNKLKIIDPNTYINLPINDLIPNIIPLSKDQSGCRYLQSLLEKDPSISNLLFTNILPNFTQLCKDIFANYLIQKLFLYLSEQNFNEIISTITTNFFEIGINPHGTRVIQNLITHLTPSLKNKFILILNPLIIPLINELNGTHIVQKFCENFPNDSEFIYKCILDNCLNIAKNRHGCCVLQKYINDSIIKEKLIKNLLKNFNELCIDQFGNYLIQSIIKLNDDNINKEICFNLKDNIIFYCKHKYCSNIVEKILDCNNENINNEKNNLIDIILEKDNINNLIIDEHGNYVIQKLLSIIDENKRKKIFEIFVILIPELKKKNIWRKSYYEIIS